jgi:hypothetical protein
MSFKIHLMGRELRWYLFEEGKARGASHGSRTEKFKESSFHSYLLIAVFILQSRLLMNKQEKSDFHGCRRTPKGLSRNTPPEITPVKCKPMPCKTPQSKSRISSRISEAKRHTQIVSKAKQNSRSDSKFRPLGWPIKLCGNAYEKGPTKKLHRFCKGKTSSCEVLPRKHAILCRSVKEKTPISYHVCIHEFMKS